MTSSSAPRPFPAKPAISRGKIQDGGNPFEAPREREYPLPPLTPILASEMFSEAARNAGYHPFPRPSANASEPYTNPDGSKFGACQYCGYCQRFGCEANAKGSPHITVIPIAMARPNFELRTNSWVTKDIEGLRRQTRYRRHLHQHSQRGGIRAAGCQSCCYAPTPSTTFT